jgi:hypothetical protein
MKYFVKGLRFLFVHSVFYFILLCSNVEQY